MAGYFSPSIAKSILCNENDLLINFHFSHLVIIRLEKEKKGLFLELADKVSASFPLS